MTTTLSPAVTQTSTESWILKSLKFFSLETGFVETDPRLIVARLIQVSLSFLGLLAVLLILYSGFLILTSGGKEESLQKAKKTFTNTIIGLLIILSARSIVEFVITTFSEVVK